MAHLPDSQRVVVIGLGVIHGLGQTADTFWSSLVAGKNGMDWTLRESAQAKIRVMVKRILNKFGYPPDLQDAAVQTVLAQAKLLFAEWV